MGFSIPNGKAPQPRAHFHSGERPREKSRSIPWFGLSKGALKDLSSKIVNNEINQVILHD